MNLVVHQVVQLQNVLVTHRNRVGERLTRTTVNQTCLAGASNQTIAVTVRIRVIHQVEELILMSAVEHGGRQAGGAGFLREVRHILQPRRVTLNLPTLLSEPAGVNL